MVARNTEKQFDFRLPDLGEGLEGAELIEWCVHVGQHVNENDLLAKMETAKALVEIPSPRAGVIAMLHGKPGDLIKVGQPLVTFWEEPAVTERPCAPGVAQSAPQPDRGSVVGAIRSAEEAPPDVPQGKPQAAPAVRKLAHELAVDLDHVSGTGLGGRITARDVRAAAQRIGTLEASGEQPDKNGHVTRIPFRGVRRTIADHLRQSVSHAVHFTVMDEADVTALEDLRRRLVAASNEKITLLPFVASAVCRVLSGHLGSQFARLNSTVDDERQEIVQHQAVHLGIATDTENGLMVPVIRDADRLGVLQLSRQISQLAQAARQRSLSTDLLSGSTFTISNYGSYAGRFGTPIINYPEAAILGVGRAREGVVVRSGMLGVGRLLPLSLAADHRVIDGATAATALAKIIDLLQSPQDLLPPGTQDRMG